MPADGTAAPVDQRDLVCAAEDAAYAMHRYADLLTRSHEPDDTRFQLRAVAEHVIEEVGLSV